MQVFGNVATQPERKVTRIKRTEDAAIAQLASGEQAATLPSLHSATQRCRECPLGSIATQAVNGKGSVKPQLMFVGEQPGDKEDLAGEPFIGPAGQLFQRALDQLGQKRESIFVTNAVRHFSFELRGKRRIHKTPTQAEAAACLHWLENEIDLVQPGALVALGATAARSLLGRKVAVMSERGQWIERDDGRAVLVTVHPSSLLRTPDDMRAEAFEKFTADLAVAFAGRK